MQKKKSASKRALIKGRRGPLLLRPLLRHPDHPDLSALDKITRHKVSGFKTLRDTARQLDVMRNKARANSAQVDPDDAPELTEEYFERADLYHGDKLVRRGRPPSANPKQALKLRIDADIVEHFRATGPGWQTRINDTLRRELTRAKRRTG